MARRRSNKIDISSIVVGMSYDINYYLEQSSRSHRKIGRCIKQKGEVIMQTSAGKITTRFYDDVCAKGIQIFLDDEIVVMLDVYEPAEGETEGEARVLVYQKAPDLDEPTHCITINRN